MGRRTLSNLIATLDAAIMLYSLAKRAVPMKRWLLILCILVGACSPREDKPIPTLYVPPTFPPTATLTPSPPATITPSPTVTITPSATVTMTPSPTVTLTPTVTPTPTPTNTLTPTPVQIVVSSAVGAYVRSGPGTVYEVVGVVDAHQVFDALAYAHSGDDVWYLIRYGDDTSAWVSGWVADRAHGAGLEQIALAATIPPSPTPSPTNTPEPASPTPTLLPGANAWIESGGAVNLRSGPGTIFASTSRLAPYTPLNITGRNADATWYSCMTFDGRVGWVSADFVALHGVDLANLPLLHLEPTAVSAASSSTSSQPLRTIYQQGQRLGNLANAFIVIGDSTSGGNNAILPFFTAFGRGSYTLGQYSYLQSTIDFFAGSFGATFQTAQSGFATWFVLDPMWANPALCQPGETPLTCEIRLRRPSVAFVYIGIMDMLVGTPESYAQNLNTIVQTLTNSGVIPVLSTLTTSDATVTAAGNAGKIEAINRSIRLTANRYQIPLIDLQQAAHGLPNQGCLEDGHHLSFRVDGVTHFTGDEQIYGKDLRELLSLQMLHELRQTVFGG